MCSHMPTASAHGHSRGPPTSNHSSMAVFTARRLAKRGICRRRVSVCLCVCVCHTPVLYQNGKTLDHANNAA